MSETHATLPDELLDPDDADDDREPQHEDDEIRGDGHFGLTPPG